MIEIVGMLLIVTFIGCCSTMFHELAHACMCKLLNARLLSFKAFFLCYDGKKLFTKLSGKNHCAFKTNDKRVMKQIVAAGPVCELIIAIVCFVIFCQVPLPWIKYGFLGGLIWIVSTVAVDLLPIANGDGRLLFTKGE